MKIATDNTQNDQLTASSAHQQMWFLEKLGDAGKAYRSNTLIHLRGTLDEQALRAAIAQLIARHEVLRMKLSESGGNLVREVIDIPDIELPIVDLSGLVGAQRDRALSEAIAVHVAARFDLGQPPLIRWTLFKVTPTYQILLQCDHHNVHDSRSFDILVSELAELYSAGEEGRAPNVALSPSQYGTFCDEENLWLKSEECATAVGVLRDRLAPIRDELGLFYGRRRTPVRGYQGHNMLIDLTRRQVQEIQDAAIALGVSKFAVLLSVFCLLCARYDGRRTFSVGVPFANRPQDRHKHTVGMFTNMLPVAVDVQSDETVAAFIRRVSDETRMVRAYSSVPVSELVKALGLTGTLRGAPPFNASFTMHDSGPIEPKFGALETSIEPTLFDDSAKVDLSMVGFYRNHRPDSAMQLLFECDKDVFDAATVESMSNDFQSILRGVVANDGQPLRLLNQICQPAGEAGHCTIPPLLGTARNPTIHGLFEEQAARTPDAIALVSGDVTWSYRDLDARATQLAALLRKEGMGPGTLVGLCVPRSADMVAALLGILKCGAAYLPLDESYPEDRLKHMIADSRTTLILTHASLLGELEFSKSRLVAIDREMPVAVASEDLPAQRPAGAGDAGLAYVIYTSGSTGQPKGVMVRHDSVVNLLLSMAQLVQAVPGDRLAAVTPISFDIAALELLLPLICGASVHVLARSTAADSFALHDYLIRENISLLQMTPSMWRAVLEDLPPMPHLRALCGGEMMDDVLAKKLMALTAHAWNVYGPTETTIWSTAKRLASGAVTVGKPIAGTDILVLDDDMCAVPFGVAGEVYIGGIGVADGYLDRPALTTERFVPNPLKAGARLYRTGDRGFMRHDGELVILGRTDQQVKIRGHRIELGELEAALSTIDNVAAAAVIAVNADNGKVLAAYVVARDPGKADADALRHALSERLPAYMMPTWITWIEAMPLTPNGKIDRLALPAPQSPISRRNFLAPSTAREVLVANIWSQILGVERIGLHDNFFDLGGHSLMAMKIVAKATPFLNTAPSVALLFNAPTVAEFVKYVDASVTSIKAVSPSKTARRHLQSLSHQQETMWMAGAAEEADAVFNVPLLIDIAPAIDPATIRAALDELAGQNIVLHSRIVADNDQPNWEPVPDARFSLLCTDAIHAQEVEDAFGALKAEAEFLNRPFDLRREPPCRGLLTLSRTGQRLLLVFHHIAVDGWSLQIIVDQLTGKLGKASVNLPAQALAGQYSSYVASQRDFMASKDYEKAISFWKESLAEVPAILALPADGERADGSARAGQCARRIPSSVAAKLKNLALREGLSQHMTIMSALYIVLARWTGQYDLVLGVPSAGRTSEEFEQTIGMFVNILPIRVQGRPEMTTVEVVRKVKAQVLTALDHATVPFDKIVEVVAPARHRGVPPLVQVLVNTLPELADRRLVDKTVIRARGLANPFAKFDITIYVRDVNDGHELSLSYAQPLFRESTAEAMLGQMLQALDALSRPDDISLEEVQLGKPASSVAARKVAQPGPVPTIPERFSYWANKIPASLAVCDAQRQFTYRQVDGMSHKIMRRLLDEPDIAGKAVALYCERSAMLPVAMLGILRAGMSIMVLDPSYPPERIAAYVAQAEIGAILVHGALPPEVAALITRQCSLHMPVVMNFSNLDEALEETEISISPQGSEHNAGAGQVYLLATSGTTGTPKVVASPLSSVAAFLDWQSREFGFAEADRFCMLAGLSHDPLMRDAFAPMWCGGSLHVPSQETLLNQLGDWLCSHRISVAHITPSLFNSVAASSGQTLEHLRWVFFGGEKLDRRTVDTLVKRTSIAEAVNFYGATETPQAVSFHRFKRSDELAPYTQTIGRGTAIASVHVLDKAGREAADKELGEIVVRTDHLSHGYLNDPQLTAAKFRPCTAATGQRQFHTGDLGRRGVDGNITVEGRADTQVKLRGLRVELAEVEAILSRDAAVRQSAVTVESLEDGSGQLVAHIVPQKPEADTAENRSVDLSLFFFADGAGSGGGSLYSLYLDMARIADEGGLKAIWTPERHFTEVAAAYPNPSVLCAALATMTSRVELRAGSVVLPLHHPIRVAEEWAVVDNLSHGRVGVSFAGGWVPDDFIFAPDAYADRQATLLDRIHTVRRLWKGEALELENGVGKLTSVRSLPLPVQDEIPVWLTAVGNPATFEAAGRNGFNLLTSMTTQSPQRLAASIKLYRNALAAAGFDSATRTVTVMLHAFVGETDEEAHEIAGASLQKYFDSHTDLRRQVLDSTGEQLGTNQEERQILVRAAVDRVIEARSLIGSVETCRRRIREMQILGVDELACLVDFGIDADRTLASARRLTTLNDLKVFDIDHAALRQRVSALLPQPMVPARFISWPALPLTANGKLDTRALIAKQEAEASACGKPRTAPRNAIEIAVHEIWSELMNIKEIDVHDDFFSVGGYSLLIPRLMSQLRHRLDVELTLKEFLEGPTIEQLARRLEERGAGDGRAANSKLAAGASSVIRLTSGSSGPLVLVHPVGGGLSCYDQLIRALDPDVAVFGIAALPVQDQRDVTLVELATHHADDLNQAIPHGMLHLCGWSFGGVLAHEIATQLRQMGRREVEVTLIDAFPTHTTVRLDENTLRARYESYRLRHSRSGSDVTGHGAMDEYATFLRNHRALQVYRPTSSNSWATLFAATLEQEPVRQRLAAWSGQRAPGFKLIEFETNHEQILSAPHIEHIAAHILDRLDMGDRQDLLAS